MHADLVALGYCGSYGRDVGRVSALDKSNDFSMCDGLWFMRPSNAGGAVKPLMWIETDDNAYTDVTNCMLLASQPGTLGDGGTRTITRCLVPEFDGSDLR